MPKVIVTGGRGQLGRAIQSVFISDGWSVWAPDIEEWDISENDERFAAQGAKCEAGDILFNCAAMTDVDGCEVKHQLAYNINARAAGYLADLCAQRQMLMIHISTDYVFSGHHASPYFETDLPEPQTVYGKTKLEGERLVQRSGADYYIVRTAGLYSHGGAAGKGGHTMIDFILAKARAGEVLSLVSDQYSSPTYAGHLAAGMSRLLRRRPVFGIYHMVNGGGCNWVEFGQEILRLSNLKSTINPVSLSHFSKRPAIRPQYSILSTSKLDGAGIRLPDWRQGIADYLLKMDSDTVRHPAAA